MEKPVEYTYLVVAIVTTLSFKADANMCYFSDHKLKGWDEVDKIKAQLKKFIELTQNITCSDIAIMNIIPLNGDR